eukprot:scaffold42599_cov59-Phaeocystis_antarctica.AAC.2
MKRCLLVVSQAALHAPKPTVSVPQTRQAAGGGGGHSAASSRSSDITFSSPPSTALPCIRDPFSIAYTIVLSTGTPRPAASKLSGNLRPGTVLGSGTPCCLSSRTAWRRHILAESICVSPRDMALPRSSTARR